MMPVKTSASPLSAQDLSGSSRRFAIGVDGAPTMNAGR